MSARIPLLIDTDPGVDDALAILMALDDTGHEVVGLTIAAGNVGLRHTVANALKLCEVAGRDDIPVFAGCPEPLLHPAPDAADVLGACRSVIDESRMQRLLGRGFLLSQVIERWQRAPGQPLVEELKQAVEEVCRQLGERA